MSSYTKIKIDWYIVDVNGDDDVELEIECGLTPADPGCWTLANGDPGYPGSNAECEILSVRKDGVEVKDWEALKLDEARIAEKAFEKADDRERGAYEDHCDNERKRRIEDRD